MNDSKLTTLSRSMPLAKKRPDRDKLYVPVVEAIEAKILSGELPIGERLPAEGEIAESFNVSTRSVREAIQILETKGLIRRKHGERALVVRDDVGEFLGSLAVTVRQYLSQKSDYFVQLMDVRRIIETEAVGRLASGEGGAVLNHEVEEAIGGMRRAAASGDFALFTKYDAALHLGLVHSVGNDILNVFYNNLFALITETISVSSRVPNKSLEAAFAEHDEIYRLIKAGDADGAKASIRRHIDGSSSYIRVALDRKAAAT